MYDNTYEARHAYRGSDEGWRTAYAPPWKDTSYLAEAHASAAAQVSTERENDPSRQGTVVWRFALGLADLSVVSKTAMTLIPLALVFTAAAWATGSDKEQTELLWRIIEIAATALLAYLGFLGIMIFSHHSKIAKLEQRADESFKVFKEQSNRSNKKLDEISTKLDNLMKRGR